MRITSLVISMFFSLTMVAFGIPLMLRRIPPNGVVGIRISRTLSDIDLWYSVNAHAGKLMVWVGALLGSVALALFFFRDVSDVWYFLITTAGTIIGSLVIVLLPLLHMDSNDRR